MRGSTDFPKDLPNNGIEVVDLECLRGYQSLFRNLHCRLESGAILNIRAKNGVGKTSLLRILCGLSYPEKGEVRWNNVPISQCRAEYHRVLAYCGHQVPLNDALTPLENLDAARALWARPPALSSPLSALDALQYVALGDYSSLPCRRLSAGQRQRVGLAAMWLRPGGLWILDEPTAALDADGITLLEQMLEAQIATGGMVIFTSHRELTLGTQPQILHLHTFA